MVWFQSHDETVSSGLAQLRRDCRKFILKKDEIQLQTRCLFWPCAVLLPMHLWNNVPQPPTYRPLLQVWSPLLADQDKSWDWKSRRNHLHHPVSVWMGNWESQLYGLYKQKFLCYQLLGTAQTHLWNPDNSMEKLMVCYRHNAINALVLKDSVKKCMWCAKSTQSLSTLLKLKRMPGQSGK